MMNKPELVATDIIPMINYVWNQSFTRVDKNFEGYCRSWLESPKLCLVDGQINPSNYD